MLHFLQIFYVHPSKKAILKIVIFGVMLIASCKALNASQPQTLPQRKQQDTELNAQRNFDRNYADWKARQLGHDQRLADPSSAMMRSGQVQGDAIQKQVPQTSEPIEHPVQTSHSGTIQLNSANMEQLQQLKGVGAKKAQAILDYRLQHGPFKRVEELKNVKGIGESTLQKNRSQLSL